MNISKLVNKTMKLLNEFTEIELGQTYGDCPATHIINVNGSEYICSRPSGHKGYHIARTDTICLIWENEKGEEPK